MNEITFKDILLDIYLFVKLLCYTIYSFVDLLFKNLMPAQYVNKNIKGDNILITGAGKNNFFFYSYDIIFTKQNSSFTLFK